ncbi:Hsp20/alpha crystallin family protein [Paraburkholderia sp. BCC1884]|uniref:Hsp20/alpha crystallin family protein n=1 Tax=Paraburkholderia sp. BCC1884 TaxID=2562668 RepID=UPI001182C6C5|nr:Hsp20/alpha crystallin family protein [Paraburkholderia sp. BCC1884]
MSITRHITLWETAIDALERAERLQRQFFRLAGQQGRAPVWEPPIEVFQNDARLVIVVALPGVHPEHIEVSVDGPKLVVAAERQLPKAFAVGAVHCMEIPYGRFERHIQLPAGRYRLIRRESEHGCLLLDFERLD